VLEVALSYLARRWSVVPLRGKVPLVLWDKYKRERATEEEVRSWWAKHPDANVGVALGSVSQLVRIDADGPAALARLQELGVPETAEFETPSGGRGYLLRYMEGVVTEVLQSWPGEHQELRVQSDGAYTVVPPSPGWRWIREEPIATIPRWLHDRSVARVIHDLEKELRPTVKQLAADEVELALQHIPADDYDRWVQVGMALKSAGEDLLPLWDKWSSKSSKYEPGECARKWATFDPCGGITTRSLLYWAQQESGFRLPSHHEPITELGNARMLARLGDGRVKHTAKWGWLAWDSGRWAVDEKPVVELQKEVLDTRIKRAIASLARHMASDREAPDFEAKRKRKMSTVSALRLHEEERRVRGARKLAESEPALTADYKMFDQHPFLLNCPNGTLDLFAGELRPHDPKDMLTQLCPTPVDPGADAGPWVDFVASVVPDAGVRRFLQLFFGSCLTGDTSCQVMPVLWGSGANGKSTLVNTLLYVMGDDYAMKAKRDLLTVKRQSEHPTSVARLYRKRFVACVESAEFAALDEVLVKELTGGDPIAARRMREDEWEFLPTHKLVLVTNHKPEVRGTDDGIWRRLPLVPFTQSFLGREDPRMFDKLKACAPGVLRWLVEGCREWLVEGCRLDAPGAVKAATAGYRSEMDLLGTFLAECTEQDPQARVRVDKLLEVYASWCMTNKHRQLSGSAFSRAMNERGFPLNEPRGKYRLGLRVKEREP